jgi:hypothetical protein
MRDLNIIFLTKKHIYPIQSSLQPFFLGMVTLFVHAHLLELSLHEVELPFKFLVLLVVLLHLICAQLLHFLDLGLQGLKL